MKKLISPIKMLFLLPLAALSFMLNSFTSMPGGEGFEVYQNSKLVLQQYGSNMKDVKSLPLNAANLNDQITIKYYHCGRLVKDRHIIIRSKDNKELKNWQFGNMTSKDAGMSFRLADLSALGKKAPLNVYYSSSEIPDGKLLVSLVLKS